MKIHKKKRHQVELVPYKLGGLPELNAAEHYIKANMKFKEAQVSYQQVDKSL